MRPRSTPSRATAIRLYVAALALLAGVAVGALVLTHAGEITGTWLLPVVVALVAVEGLTAAKIAKGSGQSDQQSHEEAVLVFMALAFSPIAALIALSVGAAVNNVAGRRGLLKSVFNVVSFTAAAALALTAMNLISDGAQVGVGRVCAVLVAALIFAAGTRAFVSGALAITLGTSFFRDYLDDLRPTVLLLAGDASLGLLAGIAALSYRWSLPFAFIAMVVLSFAYSGHSQARWQRQTLNDLVSSSWDGIFLVGGEGSIELWNPAMSRLSGVSADAALGQRPSTVLGLRDSNGNSAEAFMAPGDPESGRAAEIVVRLGADEGARWLRLSRSPLPAKGHSYIVRDITVEHELQRRQEASHHAQRIEAVGRLAGGIAHDFNNLLTVIGGNAELLLGSTRGRTPAPEIVEIGQAAARASQLTRQLLAFSRKQKIDPRVLDLNRIVAESRAMLERLIGADIEFSIALAEDLGGVSADAGQIEQIIMNLVMNARDAMPRGGRLSLTTCNVTQPASCGRVAPDLAPGDYVLLTVSDSGDGMDAATARRIFEPYYTTKAPGAGTGLGLSTVYGIVKQSGGHVEVESEPGRGATFRLHFPRTAAPVEADPGAQSTGFGASGAEAETILLVEDEAAVRRIGQRMLEVSGYTVLLAGNGEEALEIARSDPQPIHALMTDILMPKMDGLELGERLSALRPEVKILYVSGHNEIGMGQQMPEGARYLQKPYSMEALDRTLRELLAPVAPAMLVSG